MRPLEERDVDRAGDVNFVAFYDVAVRHGLRPVVTTPSEARSYLRHLLAFDPLGGLVAEEDGDVVGMAWVHPRGPVATIGPVAVDPRYQGRGIGRAARGAQHRAGRAARAAGAARARELQPHVARRSTSGPGSAWSRRCASSSCPPGSRVVAASPTGVRLRAAADGDRTRLIERDGRAFGAPRPQSVDLYLRRGRVLVAERGTTLAGYAFGIAFGTLGYLGSAAADDAPVVLELLAAQATELGGAGVTLRTLVPASDRRLVDGLLALGFRVLRACHYMVRGGGTAPPPNYVLMNGDMM